MKLRWRHFWAGAFALLLAVELYTVADPRQGDTLSEQLWPLVADPTVGSITLGVFLAFSTWFVFHIWGRRP